MWCKLIQKEPLDRFGIMDSIPLWVGVVDIPTIVIAMPVIHVRAHDVELRVMSVVANKL